MTTTSAPILVATEVLTFSGSAVSQNETETWTNLGPLTATFTAPASCSPTPAPDITVFDTDHVIISGTCVPDASSSVNNIPAWVTCQPSGATYASLITTAGAAWWTYFSPGLYCPAGYTTAAAATLTSPAVYTSPLYVGTLQTAGTHVWCCPSSYTSLSEGWACLSTVTTATSTSLCDYDCANTGCDTPTPFAWDPQSQGNSTVAAAVWAVYMVHQDSDVPRKGLSTGAEIAIAVVVPVVVLLAVMAGVLALMRKRRQRRAGGAAQNSSMFVNTDAGRSAGDEIELRSPNMRQRKWRFV